MNTIDEFLKVKRFALVGASRNPKHFSRLVMADYSARGYEVVPVNPNLTEIDGKSCFRSISEVKPLPETAMITVGVERLDGAVREAIDAGIKSVWLVRGKMIQKSGPRRSPYAGKKAFRLSMPPAR